MDNSRLTVVIAQGIYLWAKMQDRPSATDRLAWEQWAKVQHRWVELVKSEQYRLFDVLLHS